MPLTSKGGLHYYERKPVATASAWQPMNLPDPYCKPTNLSTSRDGACGPAVAWVCQWCEFHRSSNPLSYIATSHSSLAQMLLVHQCPFLLSAMCMPVQRRCSVNVRAAPRTNAQRELPVIQFCGFLPNNSVIMVIPNDNLTIFFCKVPLVRCVCCLRRMCCSNSWRQSMWSPPSSSAKNEKLPELSREHCFL